MRIALGWNANYGSAVNFCMIGNHSCLEFKKHYLSGSRFQQQKNAGEDNVGMEEGNSGVGGNDFVLCLKGY